MAENNSRPKKIKAQIQGGFFPQSSPLMKGTIMTDDKKGKIDEGFNPNNPPLKPADKKDKGFVPPQSPRKPPEKPDKESK